MTSNLLVPGQVSNFAISKPLSYKQSGSKSGLTFCSGLCLGYQQMTLAGKRVNPLLYRDAFLTPLQTEQTQIRQLLQELPDQGLLYLLMEI